MVYWLLSKLMVKKESKEILNFNMCKTAKQYGFVVKSFKT